MMRSTPRQGGFTLVEVLVALTIAVIAVGTVLSVFTRQQRAFSDLDATLATHAHVRDALAILGADFSAVASSDTLSVSADSSLFFRALIGAASTCARTTSARITVPPVGDTLPITAWLVQPDERDVVMIYHDSTSTDPSRYWFTTLITSLVPRDASSACDGTAWPVSFAATGPAYDVTLASTPPDTIPPGAPVRFLRPAKYSLYRASDAFWYLGYRRCTLDGTDCDGVQPVSGPYRKGSAPPVTFSLVGAAGVPISHPGPASGISRIDVTAIDATPRALRAWGVRGAVGRDSLVTSIALRNR